MPRNQGTSRKGKPGKNERAVGFGNALKRAQGQRYRPRANGASVNGGGMSMQAGVESIGTEEEKNNNKTMSVLDMNNIDDFLVQADLANREFASERQGLVVVDATGQAVQPGYATAAAAATTTEFVFSELSVPRRPPWDETTTPQELEIRERQAFLEWRRAIAAQEEQLLRSSFAASATPFEKNLEVWRQLWRVLERSSCLLQLVDARNPLFYLSDDLRDYAAALGKPMMVLVNKSDYLSRKQRQLWYHYLSAKGWTPVFFSAAKEQEKLDEEARQQRDVLCELEHESDEGDQEGESRELEQVAAQKDEITCDGSGVAETLTREQLVQVMMEFARKHNCEADPRYENRMQFGMIGFPNVGKSSVINVLVGSSKHTHGFVRVAVASQPGKTKHFQTVMLPDNDEMMLCDCPGLVFPSFVSNTADLIASGVYPIAQMRDHLPVINLICERIPRQVLNVTYSIELPVPTDSELHERGLNAVPPPSGVEFLDTFCIARSMLAASSGVPDHSRAARLVIKDYAVGKLLYCHPPPESDDDEFFRETLFTALKSTKKLRDKLATETATTVPEEESLREDAVDDEPATLVDDGLLELLRDQSDADLVSSDKLKSHKKKHKWGSKNKRNRHNDPYGCHTSPDETFVAEMVASGVSVSAGKYGRGGYTRPLTYAGPKDPAIGDTGK